MIHNLYLHPIEALKMFIKPNSEVVFFSIDSLSEVTEDFGYDVDASATTLLANMTNHDNFNFDRCLPIILL